MLDNHLLMQFRRSGFQFLFDRR